jgi:hypothetical protein
MENLSYPRYLKHNSSGRMVKMITEFDAVMIGTSTFLITFLQGTDYEKEHGYSIIDKENYEQYALELLNKLFELAIEPD